MSSTIAELLQVSQLPRLEARLLLEQVTGYSRVQQTTYPERVIPRLQAETFLTLCQRRQQGEPIAYLLGWREFYGREFAVSPATLIPRPETELLVEWALTRPVTHQPMRYLDLGTGSGVIATSLALEHAAAHVTATDFSSAALAVAEENAKRLGAQVTFYQGSWWQALAACPAPQWDVIVSNPPYIAAQDQHLQQGDLRFEPQHALTDGQDGLSALTTIIEAAPLYLVSGGWLGLEHGFDQGEAVRKALQQRGFCEVVTERDLAGVERITVGRYA